MAVEFSVTDKAVDEERCVVAVTGEVDLFTAPQLKTAISDAMEGGRVRIVVDLSETTFLDSTGIGVLIGMFKRLRSRDGRLALVNTHPHIAKTFDLTGLDQLFTICRTREEALAAVDGGEQARPSAAG